MKILCFVTCLLSLFVACDQKPKNPVSEYGNTMMDSYQKGQQAGEIANLDAVKKAVQSYHAANDKYPQNLEEIKDLIGSQVDFSKYDYEPQSGAVSLKNK